MQKALDDAGDRYDDSVELQTYLTSLNVFIGEGGIPQQIFLLVIYSPGPLPLFLQLSFHSPCDASS